MASREIRGFFLTSHDEADLSVRLREQAVFLDDNRTGSPCQLSSLADATSVVAWILQRSGRVPTRWDALGPLVQFIRCRTYERDGRPALRVGRMAIVYGGDAKTRRFVEMVWKTFRAMCTNRLIARTSVDGEGGHPTRDVWLGPDARRFALAGGVLESNAANLYYAPS